MKRADFLLAAVLLGAASLPAMARQPQATASQQADTAFPKTEQEAENYKGNLAVLFANFVTKNGHAKWTRTFENRRFRLEFKVENIEVNSGAIMKLFISTKDSESEGQYEQEEWIIPLNSVSQISLYDPSSKHGEDRVSDEFDNEEYQIFVDIENRRKAIKHYSVTKKISQQDGGIIGEKREYAHETTSIYVATTDKEARILGIILRRLIEVWGGHPELKILLI